MEHAKTGVVEFRSGHGLTFLGSLRAMESLLRSAAARFRERPNDETFSYAAEWMLDNFYVVEQSLREVREDLPSGFYKELPELAGGPLHGYPRIYAVALSLISLSRGPLEIEQVRELTQDYQKVTPLRIGELWALPA